MLFNFTTTTHTPYVLVLHMIKQLDSPTFRLLKINQPTPSQTPNHPKHLKKLPEIFTTYFPSISTFLPPFITVCSF